MSVPAEGLRDGGMSVFCQERLMSDILPSWPVVKICGLTRMQDVMAALAAGAWALGFVFAPSPRRVTPREARDLIEGARRAISSATTMSHDRAGFSGPLTVGVFVDASVDDIAAVTRYAGLDAVQLHGPSAPSPLVVREALADWVPPRRLAVVSSGSAAGHPDISRTVIMKAVAIATDGHDRADLPARLERARVETDLVLVDASVGGRSGGTGQVLPWDIVREAAAGMPFLLAGGIRPSNVREALARSGARGVDVSSGVERAPGIKEGEAIERLIAAVNETRRLAGRGATGEEEVEGRRT